MTDYITVMVLKYGCYWESYDNLTRFQATDFLEFGYAKDFY